MTTPYRDLISSGLALALFCAWGTHLYWWLTVDLFDAWVWIVPGIAVQAILYTGLFIVAHDAMHGSLVTRSTPLNDAFGTVACLLYAAFPYRTLQRFHHKHHDYVGTLADPDGHNGHQTGWLPWYLRFIGTYLNWKQVAAQALIFNVLQHGLGIELLNLQLFWVLPVVLSTMQLFTVGTYLPHRPPHAHGAHTRTVDWPVPLAFIGCYFFGYHEAHHDHPSVPWWGLPAAKQRVIQQQAL